MAPGRPDAAGMSQSIGRKWIVSTNLTQGEVDVSMLIKVFPIPLKAGQQAAAEAIVEQFAPRGPGQEAGTLSFRVYRDPKRPDYLLFVEHFADQQAYDAHTQFNGIQGAHRRAVRQHHRGVRRDRSRACREPIGRSRLSEPGAAQ